MSGPTTGRRIWPPWVVAGEHKIDEREAGMLDDGLDVVRFMAHKDDGGAGVGGDGEVEIGGAVAGIVGAAEPEDIATAFERSVAVDEDGDSVGFDGADDVVGTDGDVMVAEDAEALRSFEGGEDLGAEAGGLPGYLEGEGAAADEVSGDEDEIGGHAVDFGDHALEEVGLGELLEVDVAHLDDAKALEAVGEIADGDGEMGDLVLVAGMGSGVGRDAEASSGEGGTEKASAGEMMRAGVTFREENLDAYSMIAAKGD